MPKIKTIFVFFILVMNVAMYLPLKAADELPGCIRLFAHDGLLNIKAISKFLGLEEKKIVSVFSPKPESGGEKVLIQEIVKKLDEMRLGCDYAVACQIPETLNLVRQSVERMYQLPEQPSSPRIIELANLISQLSSSVGQKATDPTKATIRNFAEVFYPKEAVFKNFEEWLHAHMKANDIKTQKELADQLKVFPSAISNHTHAPYVLSDKVLLPYSTFFNVPVADIRRSIQSWHQ